MKYVKYQLKSDGSQPSYSNNAIFSGGAYKCGEWYVGYLDGTSNDMSDFILHNAEFYMTEITQAEAVQLVNSSLPASSVDTYGKTIYPSTQVQTDGTIVIVWRDTPQGMPSKDDRLEAVEAALLDIVLGG